jgi:hypothetical protein
VELMRCLDSGAMVLSYQLPWRDSRVQCGNCGRRVRTERVGPSRTLRLVEHGSRQPCSACGSRSPQHHITDHDTGA